MSLYLKRELVIGYESRGEGDWRHEGTWSRVLQLLRYAARIIYSPRQREASSAAQEPHLNSIVLKWYWCQKGNKTQWHLLLFLGSKKQSGMPPPLATRYKDVDVSYKESPLAAQWLTNSLAGNKGRGLMNRDWNIPHNTVVKRKERGTYSSQHNSAFLLARTPVWGNPSKPQQEALVQDKKYADKRLWPTQNFSQLLKLWCFNEPWGSNLSLFIHPVSTCYF